MIHEQKSTKGIEGKKKHPGDKNTKTNNANTSSD